MLLLEMMKMKNRIARGLTLMLLALGLASPALAVDGVLEINETCAQAGCFNGDSPGWPVTIIRAGSYRLTSNLNVPDENTHGIVVSSDDVGIDLNDFAIIGPVVCSGSPVVCTPGAGIGSGVGVSDLNISGTSVRGGSITGMGFYGVVLGAQAEATNLRVRFNARGGINARHVSTISDNRAYLNGHYGIYVDGRSVVSGNSVSYNGGDGIFAGNGATVTGNSVTDNGGYGIYTTHGSTVSGNSVIGNGLVGIAAATASTVSDNSAVSNGDDGISATQGSRVSGNSAVANGGDGIYASSGSAVSNNSVYSNAGWGFNVTSDVGFRGNVITNNAAGTVNSGINLGGNSCDATSTCP